MSVLNKIGSSEQIVGEYEGVIVKRSTPNRLYNAGKAAVVGEVSRAGVEVLINEFTSKTMVTSNKMRLVQFAITFAGTYLFETTREESTNLNLY